MTRDVNLWHIWPINWNINLAARDLQELWHQYRIYGLSWPCAASAPDIIMNVLLGPPESWLIPARLISHSLDYHILNFSAMPSIARLGKTNDLYFASATWSISVCPPPSWWARLCLNLKSNVQLHLKQTTSGMARTCWMESEDSIQTTDEGL